MKLKGTVKITLRDAKTGRIVNEEEHSNAITPALQAIFDNNLAGTVDFSKLTPIMSRLLGGVILWRGNVYSSDIYLPKQENAKITAHAGSDTSASGDTTKGTLNTNPAATGPVPNGYKWTWDWTASNGNGNITALSLVHEDVGNKYNQNRSGAGFAFSPVEDVSNYIINANSFVPSDVPAASLPAAVGIPDQKKIPIGFYGDKNHIVSFELEETTSVDAFRGGVVHVYISKFTGTDLWLKNNIADIDIEKTIDVEPTWQYGAQTWIGRAVYYIAYDETNGHLYIITTAADDGQTPSHGRSSSWTVHIWDVNLATEEVDEKTVLLPVTKPSGEISRSVDEYYTPQQLKVINGCIFLPLYDIDWINTEGGGYWDFANEATSTSLGVRINVRTGTLEDYYDGATIDYHENNNLKSNGQVDLGNERFMYSETLVEKLASPESRNAKLFSYYCEPISRASTIFGTTNRMNRTYIAGTAGSLIQFATRCTASGDGGVDQLRGAILNKMYLASVFNLGTPVAKTSSNTMTVVYTITQVEDEES